MRLAVFTNKFPHKVSTFFARDMRALMNEGFQIDVFPLYPVSPEDWKYVPAELNKDVLPSNRLHHLRIGQTLTGGLRPWPVRHIARLVTDSVGIGVSALRFGPAALSKSVYSVLAARCWAEKHHGQFDHILAYWGNYPATSALTFQRLANPGVPFSFLLHAGVDLYRSQVYMEEKLLNADNIFVVCEFNRRYLERLFPRLYPQIQAKIHLHHLGVDLKQFSYHRGDRVENKVLGVGRLVQKKGFDVLLRATARVLARGVDMQLELIGDGPERARLVSLTNRLGISDHVRYRGWLVPDDVRTAMTDASVLVHPSIGPGDAVPTVIKEAMALGTTVIGSDTVGIPELLDYGRCGLLVPPGDHVALSAALERLLIGKDERSALSLKARRHVEQAFDLWANGAQLARRLRATSFGCAPEQPRKFDRGGSAGRTAP